MPWSSDQQRKWGHTAAGKKALGGEAAVHEWDEATKGKKLPEKVEKSLLNTSTKVPNAAKMPKTKTMAKPGDKLSEFLKSESEQFEYVKHPTLCKLRDFLQKKHKM